MSTANYSDAHARKTDAFDWHRQFISKLTQILDFQKCRRLCAGARGLFYFPLDDGGGGRCCSFNWSRGVNAIIVKAFG